VQAAWLRLCRKLAKAGLPRAAHEGALDYAARVAAARPDLANVISTSPSATAHCATGQIRTSRRGMNFCNALPR